MAINEIIYKDPSSADRYVDNSPKRSLPNDVVKDDGLHLGLNVSL